ncbi:MAG: acetyl-CoA carboxylase biotin carboxyl carrier protein subunit [Nitrosopumilaceae archaeon]
MEYKIEDIEEVFNAQIIQKLSDSEYLIKINDNERTLKILDMSVRGIEFVLDQKYHKIKYLENTTSQMKIVVDGLPITINMHQNLNAIVFKNSGDTGGGASQLSLHSQIPGKVIKISVTEGSEVKKNDPICVLESMKMQVSVKSHKDGIVKKIKIKEGLTVAKNDVIAEIE